MLLLNAKVNNILGILRDGIPKRDIKNYYQGIYNDENTYTQLDEMFNKIKIDYDEDKKEKEGKSN